MSLESLQELIRLWVAKQIDQVKIIGRMLRYLDIHHELLELFEHRFSRLENRQKRMEERLDALEAPEGPAA